MIISVLAQKKGRSSEEIGGTPVGNCHDSGLVVKANRKTVNPINPNPTNPFGN